MDQLSAVNEVCASCGGEATHALEILVRAAEVGLTLRVMLCGVHADGARAVGSSVKTLPTHHAIVIQEAAGFPPKKGELLRSPLMLACPRCGGLASLDPTVFSVSERGLKPSFICPQCSLHAWLTFGPTKE